MKMHLKPISKGKVMTTVDVIKQKGLTRNIVSGARARPVKYKVDEVHHHYEFKSHPVLEIEHQAGGQVMQPEVANLKL